MTRTNPTRTSPLRWFLTRVLTLLLALAALIPTARADITTGLVGWWKMTEGSGTTVPDSSGNNNAGAITNATWGTRHGRPCMMFDGNNDWVHVPDSTSLTVTTVTMAAWINTNASQKTDTHIISRLGYRSGFGTTYCALRCSEPGYPYSGFHHINGTLNTNTFSGNAFAGSHPQVTWSRWQHVVMVISPAGSKLYRDGELIVSDVGRTLQTGSNGEGLYLGTFHGGTGEFQGGLRDVRYYNRELTATDVQELRAQELPPAPLSLYTFDGSNLQDSSANAQHGTVTNTPIYVLGAVGNAIKMTGSSNPVNVGPDVRIEEATVSAFIRLDEAPASETTQAIVSSWAAEQNFSLAWTRDPTGKNLFTAKFRKRQDSTHAYAEQSVLSLTSFPLGVYHHVAITHDGTNLRLFVNGREEAVNNTLGSVTTTPSASVPELEIGGTSAGSSTQTWAVDDVRIFNKALTAFQVLCIATGAKGEVVYAEDFQGANVPVTGVWNNYPLATTPAGSLRSTQHLGYYHNSTANFAVSLLPVHTSVTLAFDLYLKGQWRGVGTTAGNPDRLFVSAGSQSVINTTFSTMAGTTQEFPSAGLTATNSPFVGAYETNTLGDGSDQVIRVVKTFPHTTADLAVQFQRLYPFNNTLGYWGIDNVVVSVSQDTPTASAFSLGGTVTGVGLPPGTIRMEATSGVALDKLTLTQAGSYSFPVLNGPQTYKVLAYVDSDGDAVRDPQEWVGFANNGAVFLDSNLASVDLILAAPVDADSDGLPDEWELANGLNITLNDSALDKDSDGLTNAQEYWIGSNVSLQDTDGDGTFDGVEWSLGSNALSLDSDGDGMTDAYEIANGLNPARNDASEDADLDFLTNLQEFTNSTKSNTALSGTDGISDYRRINGKGTWKGYYDKNNRFLGQIFDNGTSIIQGYDANSNPTRQLLRHKADNDGDGLLDIWEVANGLDPNSGTGVNGIGDADNDGVTNIQEYTAGTDPKSATSKTTNDGTVIATSSAFPFTPTSYVMGTGQLDGAGPEEVIVSGDGNPGAATNVLRIFTPNATGTTWTEETVNVGTVGVTSICVGHTNAANTIFIGTRAVAPAFGQIIKLTKNAGVWTPAVMAASTDQVAFVAGYTDWNSSKLFGQYSSASGVQQLFSFDINTLAAQQLSSRSDPTAIGTRYARDSAGGVALTRIMNVSTSRRLEITYYSATYGYVNQSPTIASDTAWQDVPFHYPGVVRPAYHPYAPTMVQYRFADLNVSNTADATDENQMVEINLSNQAQTQERTGLFTPAKMTAAIGRLYPTAGTMGNVLITGSADGLVNTWDGPLPNTAPLRKHHLTDAYRGMIWHEFRGLRGIEAGEVAVGLYVNPASLAAPKLVLWSAAAIATNSGAATLQTAPLSRIAASPSTGGPRSAVDVDLWDAQGNAARVILQYRLNAWSSWADATLVTLDGASVTQFVAAAPTGTRHRLIWNASADLGSNFAGNVLLRTRATDAAEAGAWSEQVYYNVGLAPEIAVKDTAPDTALTDGTGSIALGDVALGQPTTRTFTILNEGNGALNGLNVTADAAANLGLTITQPASTTLVAGASTTFSISLTPSAAGAFTLALHLASDDEDENPFDVALGGTAVAQVITLAVAPSNVTEDGSGNLVFTFTRSATAGSLTVNYSLGGSATLDEDYTASATDSVSFTNGNATATVTVDPTSDSTPEPDETVTLTVSPHATYSIGSPGNATGTILSDELPVLTTNSVTNITATDALSGGSVSSNGGTTIVERGIVFATAANPTTANANKVPVPGGTGAFTAAMGGLVPATTYYVRAYATNSAGIGYGQQVQFTTGTVPVGPNWQSPTGLEHSMTVYAQVDRDGSKIETAGSKLAAFENSNVAGVASLITGPGGIKLYQLTVWSNQANIAALPMKVFDAGTNEVLDISETLAFASNGIIGTIAAPVLYHVRPAEVDQVIPLVQGWNWISFNALPANHAPGTVLSQYTPQDNDLIKGTLGTATHFGGVWYPTSNFTLDASRLYLLRRQAASATNLTVHGVPVDATEAINLVAGWNWLGYNPQTPRQIGTALAGVTLANNDLIKGQYDGTATWFEGQWYAPTYQMAPGRGYLLKVAGAQSFAYDTAPSPPSPGEAGASQMSQEFLPSPPPDEPSGPPTASPPSWQSPIGKENSMTLYAAVEIGGQRLESTPAMLAVLEGGQVAGVAQVMQGPTGMLYQMTVWSNSTSVSGLTLAAYDPSIVIIRDLSPSVAFTANDIQGTITTPIVFGAPALTPRELWRHTHYGSIANEGSSADNASLTDSDGVSNLLEYATAMNPLLNDTEPMAAVKEDNVIEFTYTKNKAATDLTYTVEWSDTLHANDWSTTGVSAPSILSDNGTTQQAKVSVPAGSSVMRRFVRLKVTAQ